MPEIALVIFDMAGTVVNEDNLVYKTLQKAINNSGFHVSLDFVLEHGAGKEKHQAIKDILEKLESGSSDESESASIFDSFKTMLVKGYEEEQIGSFAGTEELLFSLRRNGIKVALNTGYNHSIATLLLDKMGWSSGKHYDVLITADDVSNGRPHPDMILEAMKALNITDPSTVAKVGDSAIDILEGSNANCGMTVGVTTGAHTREQLEAANPSYIFSSLQEMSEVIL